MFEVALGDWGDVLAIENADLEFLVLPAYCPFADSLYTGFLEVFKFLKNYFLRTNVLSNCIIITLVGNELRW